MADEIDVNAMVGLITGAIAVAMQLQLAKDQLALKKKLLSPFLFTLDFEILPLQPRGGGKSAIRSISPGGVGLGVMMPRVCSAEVSTLLLT